MCDRVVSKDSFLIVYCSGKYKAKRMCDIAAVTSKMIKKLFTALYADENTWVNK